MRGLGLIMAAVLVSAPADGAAQSDLSGMWILTLTTEMGPQMVTITVVQDGHDLTATGDAGEYGPIEMKGTVDGDNIRLAWDLDFQGTPIYIVFSGTVADDGMSGSADFGGMGTLDWTAKRAEG